ncbi:MAG: nucleotidyltransferase domain-containing protein [Lachnospiraceae bacterium]|nr:nucleotidyltransferase domain-containing protein [Lachnospiraceae bacterium]
MQSIEAIKKKIAPIGKAYGIKRIFLFGSYAKGTANNDSDIDLLIEKGKPLSLIKLSGLRLEVEELFNIPVDIVTTTGIDDEFRKEIAGTELLMYEE